MSKEVMAVNEASAGYLASVTKIQGVPIGYQRTEVGVIPEDWDIKTLGSITTLLTNGFVGKVTDFYVESDDGILYIQGYNVEENGFNLHGIKRVSKKFHTQHKKSCLQSGDLLTIQTGDIGVTAVVSDQLAGANCHALVISRLDRQSADPVFYCQYFNSEKGRAAFKEIETGSTMKHLNVGDMVRLFLPSPSLPEQRAIAAALSDVDALIAALDKFIAKKCAIKTAAMQQLLTGKQRLPGFSGGWEVKRLGDISQLKNGYAFKSSTYTESGSFKIVTIANVQDGYLDLLECSLIPFAPIDLQPHHKLAIRDILVSMTGNVGRVCKVTEGNCLLNQRVGKLTPIGVDTDFFFHQIRHPAFIASMMIKAKGGAQGNLSVSDILEYEVSVPSNNNEEQQAIATILSDMDAEITALEARRDKTKAIKQGMMQELLTGRIRLV